MDTQSFENKCHSVKEQVNKNELRVCKLKDKFRYLIKQNSKKKTVLRELSSCVIEKFNGFSIIPIEFSKKLRQSFHTISIIYKPVIKCYCHKKLNLAVTVSYNEGQESKAALRGNIILARIIMLDKINLIAMLKIAQFLQCTFIILTRKT